MIIRQSLWSFDASLCEQIAHNVRRRATRRLLGENFDSVAVVRADSGLALDFVFRGFQRKSAQLKTWTLIRHVAAEVYSCARRGKGYRLDDPR
jgi:hypothetical protein